MDQNQTFLEPGQKDDQKSNLANLTNNKGLIIAVVFVLIAAFFGVKTLLQSKNAANYQGLIQKVQLETQNIRNENP